MKQATSNTQRKNRKQVDHGDSTVTAATEASDISAGSKNNTTGKRHGFLEIPYTVLLPLLVMIDMMGVSLVVPLLHSQYFQLAGVTGAVQREWLSSIFSASQIVGGLFIGGLADSKVISRHVILIISFMGSAFAYAMIVQGGLMAIVVSRVTVGLVKQTMTVTSSMMAHATHEQERATHVGRLNASVTVAWIVGPSAGAYLFSHVGTYAPIYISLALFSLNTLLVVFCLPKEEEQYDDESGADENNHTKKDENDNKPNVISNKSGLQRVLSNFQACFHSDNSCLTAAVMALLLFQWTLRTTSYKNIATFYEAKFGSEPHQRGYLQSYQSALMFVVQSTLVRPILKHVGGEVNAACGAAMLMAVANFASIQVSFTQYLVLLCPMIALATAILGVTLKSVVSKVAPKQSLGSVFATIDVLQNTAQVTVPFYRTVLFSLAQPAEGDSNNNPSINQNGDPDPNMWLMSSGFHWLIATAAFSYLLLQGSPCASMDGVEKDQNDDPTKPQSTTGEKLKAS